MNRDVMKAMCFLISTFLVTLSVLAISDYLFERSKILFAISLTQLIWIITCYHIIYYHILLPVLERNKELQQTGVHSEERR